jgi:hypothetical protein
MPRRITVIAIGAPSPLTSYILRTLAREILHRLEAKQAVERQAEPERQEETPRPSEP